MLFLNTTYAVDVKTYIPPRAFEYKDILETELDRLFPELIEYNFVAALIEHESCISLTHSRCWSSTSQLKTQREQGLGFFQITRTWTADGKPRFDTLGDLRKQYMNELREANWDNLRDRPDLQMRAGILLIRQNYKALYNVPDEMNRLHMTDAAHNSGVGNTQKERRACGLAAKCDPNIWIDNVENYCQRSKKALYAGRSACDITKHHVRDVFFTRLPKYKEQYILPKTIIEEEPEEVIVIVPVIPTKEEVVAVPPVKKDNGFTAFFKKLFGRT